MPTFNFTPLERQATLSLSALFGLRLLGLFLVIPVFSLYAGHLSGATPTLMGVALGIYGLTQALLQIPLGRLSDIFPRKNVITCGLLLFIIGSLAAAFVHSIFGMIMARALQGASAVGSATLALVSDLTTEQRRPQSMAFMGMSIGLAFFLSMILGPLLLQWFDVPQLFLITALLGGLALWVLWQWVPSAQAHIENKSSLSYWALLSHPTLALLNLGILALHATLAANFFALPFALKETLGITAHQQWQVYLPSLTLACLTTLMILRKTERKPHPLFYLSAILGLFCAEIFFAVTHYFPSVILISLLVFFTAFSLLEAWLPAQVSLAAPAHAKGTAMGIYSCAQFVGIFVGGGLAGGLYGRYDVLGVFCLGIILTGVWLMIETTHTFKRSS